MNVFCRTAGKEWRRVFRHDATGLDADRRTLLFEEAWQAHLFSQWIGSELVERMSIWINQPLNAVNWVA